jgi:hypothetical protein
MENNKLYIVYAAQYSEQKKQELCLVLWFFRLTYCAQYTYTAPASYAAAFIAAACPFAIVTNFV